MCARNGSVVGCSEWDCQRFTCMSCVLRHGRYTLVSVALSSCQFRNRSYLFSKIRHQSRLAKPDGSPLTRSPLTFCCLDFPEYCYSKDPLFQRVPRSISHEKPLIIPNEGFRQKFLRKKFLATNFEHSGSACWAFAFHCWFSVFQCDFYCCWIIFLCSTFYTIHCCHTRYSPPFNYCELM